MLIWPLGLDPLLASVTYNQAGKRVPSSRGGTGEKEKEKVNVYQAPDGDWSAAC